MSDVFKGLITNAAMLLALGVLYDMVLSKLFKKKSLRDLTVGAILAVIGIALMNNPWQFSPGLFFDTRSILLSVSALFLGTTATIIATVGVIIYRLTAGSAGAIMGVTVATVSTLIGLLLRYYRKTHPFDLKWYHLYVFGVVVHCAMLLAAFTLPIERAKEVLSVISAPVMIIYPIATVLLGSLLQSQFLRSRMQEKQLQDAAFLDIMINTTPTPIYYKDVQGRYMGCNTAFGDYLGMKKEDIIGKTVFEIHQPENAEKYYAMDKELFDNPGVQHYEGRLKRNETTRNVIFNKATFNDANGTVAGIIGVISDITDFKETTEALRISEERFRLAVEAATDGIWDWDFTTGNVYWSPRTYTMLGYEPNEFPVTFDVWTKLLHPDDFERATTTVQRDIQRNGQFRAEFRLKNKKGDWQWIIGRGMTFQADVHGTPTRMLGTHVDITERKKSEQELAELTERLRLATEVGGIGIWEWNVQDDSLLWDDMMYSLYGVKKKKEQLSNAVWRERLHPEDRERALEETQKAIEGIAEYDSEFRIVIDRTQVRWIKAKAAVSRDKDGKCVRILGVNWDITALKEAQESVEQLNRELEKRVEERTAQHVASIKELEAFAYSVSHDLRAPLRIIDGYSQILADEHSTALNDEAQKLLQVIRSYAQKMDYLITDMLTISRLSRTEMNYTHITMRSLVEKVYRETVFEDIRTQFKVDLHELHDCKGDIIMIRQVWMNLLSNAVKYSMKSDEKHIEILSLEEKNEIVYYIKDRGVGFNARYKSKLFGVFQRLHRADEYEGNGVGLAIIKRIIERHGGRVWADLNGEKGAVFAFSLPKRG